MKKFKNIIWDFDGVIIDSLPIREQGFEDALSIFRAKYDTEVDELIEYHRNNGGYSRYQKFNHFFKNILKLEDNELVDTKEKVRILSNRYSRLVKSKLCNSSLLLQDTMNFIRNNYQNYDMHIVSGSADIELKYICNALGLSRFMQTINGSVSNSSKIERVNELISVFEMNRKETLLIGDSINDYDAAEENNIKFIGFNPSESLKKVKNIEIIENFPNSLNF